ncbi:hypothetical protein IWX49DRAFT_636498 [Phyllosticta citricarpa]|uniref:Uncharacterized protein n=2 Tax=Phyllosticta TaxID=121621 RepID=A0ABR1MJB7_9PEZI
MVLHKVDSPYTATKWPIVPPADHDIMLEMLLSLLSPIARYRADHITPSRGKRDKKRKRRQTQSDPPPPPPPPASAIANHITVGINSTTRHLERLVENKGANALPTMPLIITSQSPSSPVVSHLPLLSAAASCSLPPSQATRIVPLNPNVEPQLAAALGLPRVGVVGIKAGAPGAAPLVEYAQSKLEAADAPWVREARAAEYRPVSILTVDQGRKGDGKMKPS